MDYAAARFAQNGYHPTSVAEIVEGLGVGKGVFYWYFSSKDELLREILREAQTDLRRGQQQRIERADDPLERIEAGIRATMHWMAEHRHLVGLFQFAASEERFGPSVRVGQDLAVSDVVRHVKDGIVAGTIRDADPLILAHGILGVINQFSQVFLLRRSEDPDGVADAAVAFCRSGLAA